MRVILAPRRAAAIALRNPEALVVDYAGQCIRRGADRAVLGTGPKATHAFLVAAAYCCAINGHVWRSDLVDLLWGDDAEGGPLRAENVLAQVTHRMKPFLAWAGLRAVNDSAGRIFVTVAAEPAHGLSMQISFRRVLTLKAAA